MGNLGRYQDITTLAKQAGGVDNLITNIEKNAVAKAAPRIFGAGVVITATLVSGGQMIWNRVSKRAAAREELAEQSKKELRNIVEAAERAEEDPTLQVDLDAALNSEMDAGSRTDADAHSETPGDDGTNDAPRDGTSENRSPDL